MEEGRATLGLPSVTYSLEVGDAAAQFYSFLDEFSIGDSGPCVGTGGVIRVHPAEALYLLRSAVNYDVAQDPKKELGEMYSFVDALLQEDDDDIVVFVAQVTDNGKSRLIMQVPLPDESFQHPGFPIDLSSSQPSLIFPLSDMSDLADGDVIEYCLHNFGYEGPMCPGCYEFAAECPGDAQCQSRDCSDDIPLVEVVSRECDEPGYLNTNSVSTISVNSSYF